MKVFKFGGASVKDAGGIRNLASIVTAERTHLAVVVSAFGKTTNALERVLKSWFNDDMSRFRELDEIYDYHSRIYYELFEGDGTGKNGLDNSFAGLREYISGNRTDSYDYEYDQIVSHGEIWSTMVVASFLLKSGIRSKWIDIRESLLTDDRYRDANILWNESSIRIRKVFSFTDTDVYITQGFIGATAAGRATTLGREGSDYTAAVLANILDAGCVVVWKDVPGLLNADPKWMPDAGKMAEVSYREAVEMTFSGAKVIHPKTIKPLHNKKIPLYVKSFLDPGGSGTLVTDDPMIRETVPVFIRKESQILITLLPKDFSFVMGDRLSILFQMFMQHGIKVNLVEASAVSINICVDDERAKVGELFENLKEEYSVLYNENVELLSVRHYNHGAVERITRDREILLEQRTRSTVRFVAREVVSR